MQPITNFTNKISHTLNNSENIPPDEKENEMPSDVLARLKRLAEEYAENLEKDLDILDIKIPPLKKEMQNCIKRAEDIEKYLRATVADCKITSDGHLTPNELTEIAEQRISVNETLVKACEARSATFNAEYPITSELLKLQTKSQLERELQHIDTKTRDLLMQRFSIYDEMLRFNWAFAINNKYCLGRNVYFIEENITSIQKDTEQIMNQVDSEEKKEWKERLSLCDKHLNIIKEEEWDVSKKEWLKGSRRKGFQPTYII